MMVNLPLNALDATNNIQDIWMGVYKQAGWCPMRGKRVGVADASQRAHGFYYPMALIAGLRK
jgi:hypothetical protein